VWVRGDLCELNRNDRWAYVFMTLRDPEVDATLRLRMSRRAFDRLQPAPTVDSLVLVHGWPSVFERTAELSLRVDHVESVGEGALLARIEQARRRLAADGIFDESRKRPPPFWPRLIGIVCGSDAAAPRDVIENARTRFPAARFVLAETPVQGPAAAAGIVAALQHLEQEPEVDVVVVTRGGGSLEDLLAFSDESVCRAIAACRVPVVSAVGHERDTPLCDLAADVRASTPTAAARLIVPDRAAEIANLERLRDGARRSLARRVERASTSLAALAARPALRSPGRWVESRQEALGRARGSLDAAAGALVPGRREGADALAARLRTVAPPATLARGYAIVRTAARTVVSDAAALAAGDEVELVLSRGSAAATVTEVTRAGG
jgi:exodeoxyribonuclease VII large subunit